MPDAPTYSIASARAAAADDDLDRWVAEFLASPGSDNAELAEELTATPRWWIGPVAVPLDQLHRLAGPDGHPVLEPVDESWWRDDVEDLADDIAEGEEAPPVVATYAEGRLLLEDGNHRVEALRRAGVERAWTVVGFDSGPARAAFLSRVGRAAPDPTGSGS